MARPPLPADQRRNIYVGIRLAEADARSVQAVADVEHAGNLSAAIRTLLGEAIAARHQSGTRPNVG